MLLCPSTAVETAIAQYTSCCAMARGHRPLPLFWRRSTASSVFRVGARGRAFTLSPPSPLSPSLISNLASVDVKQNVNGKTSHTNTLSLMSARHPRTLSIIRITSTASIGPLATTGAAALRHHRGRYVTPPQGPLRYATTGVAALRHHRGYATTGVAALRHHASPSSLA